mgnify:CR=1 FL=1
MMALQPAAASRLQKSTPFSALTSFHLDVQAALLCQCGNGVIVGEGAVFCAVQIDDMEMLGPRGHKLPRLGAGIGTVDSHFIVIALGQADDLTIPQVNGGI